MKQYLQQPSPAHEPKPCVRSSPQFWTLFTLGLLAGFCVVKVMAADPAEAQVSVKRSLNDPSEKDGDEKGKIGKEVVFPTVSVLREQVRTAQESLALANAEAELFSREYKELRLRNELMGVDVLTADERKLQDRVIQAVRELYQTEQERRELVSCLEKLIQTSQELLKTAERVDPQKRADHEVALRSAKEVISQRGKASVPLASSLVECRIVQVNSELNSVILNIGSRLQVRPGMPFRVTRDGKLIGKLRAFQVRESVTAAVIESLVSGSLLVVGDLVTVAAEK
jgi:hypothetical protein